MSVVRRSTPTTHRIQGMHNGDRRRLHFCFVCLAMRCLRFLTLYMVRGPLFLCRATIGALLQHAARIMVRGFCCHARPHAASTHKPAGKKTFFSVKINQTTGIHKDIYYSYIHYIVIALQCDAIRLKNFVIF